MIDKRTQADRRIATYERAIRRGGADPEALLLKCYNVTEAAGLTGLAVKTIRNLTSRGEIPVVRFGRKAVRYRAVDLLQWIEARSEAAA